jgi:cellulase/cellobiase CelA1
MNTETQQTVAEHFETVFNTAPTPAGKRIWLDLGICGDSVECMVTTSSDGIEAVHAKYMGIMYTGTGRRYVTTKWVDISLLVDEVEVLKAMED